MDALGNRNVVVFAGAGIRTENRDNAKDTFYDRIASELNNSDELKRPDGRMNLIKRIKDRFDYFISFDDFYNSMTRFHKSIAPLI